ncbi:MAG: hypothetical protein U9N79_03010 [Actinomycetota bacterium]|nr:hypothetical protein [Actinomycetota bacterium]
MAQQPNIDLRTSGSQWPVSRTGPERPWTPNRPGELTGTGMPWGGAFGMPGPDAGYALKLAAPRELILAEHEHRADANAAVAAVAAARSSLVGRGPTRGDIDAAIVILGYDTESEFGPIRAAAIGGSAHHPNRIRGVIAGIPADVYDATADELRERAASGESLIEI